MSEKNVTEISFDGENPYEKIYEAYKLTDAFVYSAGELFHLPENTLRSDLPGNGYYFIDYNSSLAPATALILFSILSIAFLPESYKAIGVMLLIMSIWVYLQLRPPVYPDLTLSSMASTNLLRVLPTLTSEGFQPINDVVSVKTFTQNGLTYEHIKVNGLFDFHTHEEDVLAVALTDGISYTVGNKTTVWKKDQIVKIPANVPHKVEGQGELASMSRGHIALAARTV